MSLDKDKIFRENVVTNLRKRYDLLWGKQIRSEGYNVSLVGLEAWQNKLNAGNAASRVKYKYTTLYIRCIYKLERKSPEKWNHENLKEKVIAQDYGSSRRYVQFYGILRAQMGKTFNVLAHGMGIRRFWVNMWHV